MTKVYRTSAVLTTKVEKLIPASSGKEAERILLEQVSAGKFDSKTPSISNLANKLETELKYLQGDIVEHEKFGKGEVLELDGFGGDERIKIKFADNEKWLLMKYAPLKVVKKNVANISKHKLKIENIGGDTYCLMSKGHHEPAVFMAKVREEEYDWPLGNPEHVWVKTTPCKETGLSIYNIVPEGTKGAWPATYTWEAYGDEQYTNPNEELVSQDG